ncbi:MAG: ATP-binding cassette domain-containing protein [Gammaproteobacteria bacterium]|nr:ATP-binding cassette domain-containing protein [Gammaproteobacteria bacterium]
MSKLKIAHGGSKPNPTMGDKQPLGNISTLRNILQFVLPYKKVLFAAATALIFTSAVTLSIGQGLRILIDEGFAADSQQGLIAAAQLLIVLAVLMAIGTFIRFYLVSWLGERVSADIRQSVFDHLLTLHPSYFETNRSGEIMSRLTTDTTLLQSIIGSSFSMALRSFLMLIGSIIMLLITSLKMTLIVLAAVPLVLLPVLLYGKRVRKLSRKSQDSIADVGTYAGEIIQQIKTVQSFTNETHESKLFRSEVEKAFDIARKRILQRSMLIAMVILMVFGGLTGMMWSGGNDVLSGAMSGGELGAFVFYAFMVGSAFATISEVYGELQRAAGATERLMELLHVKSEINIPDNTPDTAGRLTPHIVFEKLDFNYPSRPDEKALDDFTLEIKPGASLALVGPSGAGKSTIFELMQRFYDPQKGQILFDNHPLISLDPQKLRQQMALVPQQPALFSNNVWHNIGYGNIDATQEKIQDAARSAFADDFIQALPQGYDSYLGEQGVRLSGGQRQRIAIARAILKDPEVLLLDEATSALDAESEQQVQLALQSLMKDRTTIIIAHRLSTILHVDQIAVMDKGKLIAKGSHQELLESCPLYKRLADLQFNEGKYSK